MKKWRTQNTCEKSSRKLFSTSNFLDNFFRNCHCIQITYGNITVFLGEQHGKTNPIHDGSDSVHRDFRLRANNVM